MGHYPWHHDFNPSNCTIKTSIRFIQFVMFMYFIGEMFWVYSSLDIDSGPFVVRSTFFFCNEIFIWLPNCLSVPVQAVIFLKYRLSLSALTSSVREPDKVNMSMNELLIRYKKLKEQYKEEYASNLQWSMQLFLVILALDIWRDTYNVIHWQKLGILVVSIGGTLLIWVLFVTFASELNKSFDEFKTSLYEYGDKFVQQKNENKSDYVDYNHLLLVISEYPIKVTVGSLTITQVNALKFMVGFTAAKVIAYYASTLY